MQPKLRQRRLLGPDWDPTGTLGMVERMVICYNMLPSGYVKIAIENDHL